MKLRDIRADELVDRFHGNGVCLRVGPFDLRVKSSVDFFIETFQFLYRDYEVPSERGFIDFDIQLDPPAGIRRWVRPQVVFQFGDSFPFEPFPYRLATPFFEWGINWCVYTHIHRYLIVHSAVVERNGQAILLPGESGAGKSTLCAALVSRGWRLLSDEFALVRPSDGQVDPIPRPIGLKGRSIAVMKEFAPSAGFSPEFADTRKGTVVCMRAPSDAVARAHEPARPAWIVFPAFEEGRQAILERIPRCQAFIRVSENCFNYRTLGATAFECLADIIAWDCSFDLTYGRLDDAIEVLGDLASKKAASA